MKRKTKILLISYGAALLLVLNAALLACHVGAGGYHLRLDAHANRAFGETFSAVDRLDTSLKKLPFATNSAMENAVCTEIFSDAHAVETALSILPVELDALTEISKHVSVVGDYAFTLARAAAEGERIPTAARQTLSDFADTTETLRASLDTLRQQLADGAVIPEHYARLTDALDNLQQETTRTADTLDAELHALSAEFEAVPAISYDGQYTDHSEDRPKALAGKTEVTQAQACRTAADFLGLEISALTPLERAEGEIPCWRFYAEQCGGTSIAVTVQGGEVMRVLAADQSGASDDADAAVRFLSEHRYSGFRPYPDSGEHAYVPVAEEVWLLPDQITLLLSEHGEVLRFDASEYLQHHAARDLSAFQGEIDVSDAAPAGMRVSEIRDVLLLSPGGQERPCAELTCASPEGIQCRIDYNLETMRQERLQIL